MSVTLLLSDELDIARSDLLAAPSARSAVTDEFDATLCSL